VEGFGLEKDRLPELVLGLLVLVLGLLELLLDFEPEEKERLPLLNDEDLLPEEKPFASAGPTPTLIRKKTATARANRR
jgi:hypothetical protein